MGQLVSIADDNELVKFLPNSGIQNKVTIKSPLPSKEAAEYSTLQYDQIQLVNASRTVTISIQPNGDVWIGSASNANAIIIDADTGDITIDGTLTANSISGESGTQILTIHRPSGHAASSTITVNEFQADSTRLVVDGRTYIRKTDNNPGNYDYEETGTNQITFNVAIDAADYPIFLEYKPG